MKKRESFWRLFPAYLRRRLLGIVTFLLYALVFAVVLWLYREPLAAVRDAVLCCVLLSIALVAWDFARFVSRHRQLEALLPRISLEPMELPAPRNLLEADYQALLLRQSEISMRYRTEIDSANSEMMEYFATWVHQIKTPIAAMRLLLQSEAQPDVPAASTELFRIEQYVDMVLTYLRSAGESNDFVFRYYELDDIIRQAVRKFAPFFVRKRLRLCYEPKPARVLTDEKWLLFVVEQLLANALKYTETGSITIEIAPGPVLHISDTGIGIAPEDLPRVTEKGFTGYNGRLDKRATGIGLFLCKQVLGKLSSPLTLASTPGVGTRVSIDLGKTPLEIE